MSMSTLNLLSGLLTPDFLRTAARATGETEGGVSKALGAAFPAVLGALVNGAGNSTMMNSVIDMVKQPAIGALLGPGGGVLGSVGSLLAPNATGGPVGSVATSLLSSLFGKNVGGIAGALGSLAGLKGAGSASSLLSLAAPMVLAALGNRLGKSLTGTALAVLLGQEKNGILSAVPPGLSGMLSAMTAPAAATATSTVDTIAGRVGSAAAASTAPQVAHAPAPAQARAQVPVQASRPQPAPQSAAPAARPAPAAYHDEDEPRRSPLLGSILGLLLTAAIIAGVAFLLNQCSKAPSAAPAPKAEAPVAPKAAAPAPKAAEAPKPVEKPKEVAAAPPVPAPVAAPAPVAKVSLLSAMKPADGGLMSLALPTGKSIGLAPGGLEASLIGFLEDASKPLVKGTWFDFDRLTFKTASSELTPESRAQVDAVAEIMRAFPTSQIKIGGYTDNQGDPAMNLKLSDDRARRVMSELVSLGVGADRVSAEGYGEQHAIADNATPEGRARNRRTALSVRQR